MTEEPKSLRDQANDISQGVMNVLVGTVLKRHNALNKSIPDEEKAKIRNMVEDLKNQVENFMTKLDSDPLEASPSEPEAAAEAEEKAPAKSKKRSWRKTK